MDVIGYYWTRIGGAYDMNTHEVRNQLEEVLPYAVAGAGGGAAAAIAFLKRNEVANWLRRSWDSLTNRTGKK